MTREEIIASNDLPSKQIDVPEWGGPITVRTLNGAELWSFQKRFAGKTVDVGEVLIGIIIAATMNGVGKMFTDADAEALAQKNPLALSRVANAAFDMNPSLTATGIKRAEENS